MVSEPVVASDSLLPFMIHDAPIRGRVVRLSHSVSQILARHAYPPVVSKMLAEALVVAAMMASNLKEDGVFTVQIQAKGAISLLVVDATHAGHLRGYAQFDEARLAEVGAPDLASLCGEGYLAITLDQGDDAQRYQGVVPLEGESVADAIEHYFTHSQQLDVRIQVVVGTVHDQAALQDVWVAGGIMIERMPDLPNHGVELDADAWDRTRILLKTLRDDEVLDTHLPLGDLLHRLFHEDGVWVYVAHPLFDQCRCSREKIAHTLREMGEAAIGEMQVEGRILVSCQFCSSDYQFEGADIKRLLSL